MLGGVADQLKKLLNHFVKKCVVVYVDAARPVSVGGTVFVIHINQVNVAGDIQLGGAELAHADHPQLRDRAIGTPRQTVAHGDPCHGFFQRYIQCEFSQPGHSCGDHGQRRLLLTIQYHQPLHDQLTQHPQSVCGKRISKQQCAVTSLQHQR